MDATRLPFYLEPLLVLVAVLAASVLVFVALTKRWTSHRAWTELQDWARNNGLALARRERSRLPPPLDQLASKLHPMPRWMLTGKKDTFVELASAMDAANPNSAADPLLWHMLLRKLDNARAAPTGLRPASQRQSALDLFSLSSFPNLSKGDRFVVYGTDSAAARAMSESSAVTLLPPDIGLLVIGEYLLLDFSTRPFDPIEFGRMLALMNQVQKVV
jgi:hypothetical protein